MSRWIYLPILVLFLVLAGLPAACGGGEEPSSQTGAAGQTTVADPLESWIEYSAPDGSFTVRLPEQPEVQQQTIETAEGDVTIVIYAVEGEEAAWLISTNTMPPITAGTSAMLTPRNWSDRVMSAVMVGVRTLTRAGLSLPSLRT